MFYLGQVVNYVDKQKPVIFLGSERDKQGYVAWIFSQQDDKTFDTEIVDLEELDNLRVEKKDAPTKGSTYLGTISRDTMSGFVSEKDQDINREKYIKEINKAAKLFFKAKK